MLQGEEERQSGKGEDLPLWKNWVTLTVLNNVCFNRYALRRHPVPDSRQTKVPTLRNVYLLSEGSECNQVTKTDEVIGGECFEEDKRSNGDC